MFARRTPLLFDLDGGDYPAERRHTFATDALHAGLSIFELARYMGTRVQMIDRTYGHLARGSEALARAKLDAAAERLAR